MKRIKMICRLLLMCIVILFIAQSMPPVDLCTFSEAGMVAKTFEGPDGHRHPYVLYVPPEYDRKRALPIIIFLHGAADIGRDGRRQLKSGLAPEVWSRFKAAQAFPYFVLFPQAQDPWSIDSSSRQRVIEILDVVQREYVVDCQRVYLTGISTGGEGLWQLATSYPTRFSAVIPVSCGASRINADAVKRLPIRWYQNNQDDIVSVRKAVEHINTIGGNAQLVEYDDPSHDAWTKAYHDDGLYQWLGSHPCICTSRNTAGGKSVGPE